MKWILVLVGILSLALAAAIFGLKVWLASVIFQWVQRRHDRKISKYRDS